MDEDVEVAWRQRALEDTLDAQPDHSASRDSRDDIDRPDVARFESRGFDARLDALRALAAKLFELVVFAAERLDDPQRRHRFLRHGRHSHFAFAFVTLRLLDLMAKAQF